MVSGLNSLFFLPKRSFIAYILAGQNNILRKNEDEAKPVEEGFINCCFSFRIRRDKWGIPSMIVGNFIKYGFPCTFVVQKNLICVECVCRAG